MSVGVGNNNHTKIVIPFLNDYDHFVIPLKLETIKGIKCPSKMIKFGKYTFSNFRVPAEIVSITEKHGVKTEYKIREPGSNDTNLIAVIHSDHDKICPFVEGSLVQIFGKLIYYNTQLVIEACKIWKIDHIRVVEICQKEARVAELYFTKNIPERIANDEKLAHFFEGTMLSSMPPPSNKHDVSNSVDPIQNTVIEPVVKENCSKLCDSSQPKTKEWNPQQEKILSFLKSSNSIANANMAKLEGSSFAKIKDAVKGDARFSKDISKLVKECAIYQTIDDDHFAAILDD